MTDQPMIEALRGSYPRHQVARFEHCLAHSFMTVVEILEYYDKMGGYEEIDRLGDVRKRLAEALAELIGAAQVDAWEAEAKSPEYSPFA